ncbi:S8 family serine peptidase [Patescibacteria group bacterium]|nr:S8 family serine peptidase [Patescibacteria group bacterium]
MQTKTNILMTVFLGLAFIVGAVGVTPLLTQAAESPRVDVLIGFTQAPGLSGEALVRSNGGNIKYNYNLIPAIAASIPESAITGLLNNPRITSVDLDGTVYAIDAELDNTWGVKHIGSGIVHNGGNKGAGVKIAIIDSGIDYTHQDLAVNYAGGYDFVNNDTDPMDDNGHGTHVAGTVAAGDDNLGVVGVAPEASLYALKVLSSSGSGSWSDVIAALEWTVNNGVHIANLSLGSSANPGDIVASAFENAETAGVVIVAAAGNDGNPPGRGDKIGYPAVYGSVIAVGATDKSDKRASFSSTGSELELMAPGVIINSTKLGGGYVEFNGTSMASPHVAGSAALVIAAGISDTNGDGRINDEVRQIMNDTAIDLGNTGRDSKYGYGLVSVVAAVATIAPPPATGTISGTVIDNDTLNPIVGASVTDGTRQATTDINGAYTLTNVPEGTYTVTASATDYNSASQIGVAVVADTITTADFTLTAIMYGAIDGIVTDVDTGNPIEGATVTDGIRQATTDTTGYYIISDVPEGTYTVTAGATGYQDASQPAAVTGGVTSTANFSLQAVTQASNVIVNSITYVTEGGKNSDKHLLITIAVVDDFGAAVSGALVSIDLSRDGSVIASGNGTTGTDGMLTFSLKNAKSRCYETNVTNVTADGLTWDGLTPANGFCK